MRAVATVGGGTIQSPWLTAAEAAAYLRIASADGSLQAFYLAYPRMGIPAYRAEGCRSLRFLQDDLDAALKRAQVDADGAGASEEASEPRLTKSPRSNPGSAPTTRRPQLRLASGERPGTDHATRPRRGARSA